MPTARKRNGALTLCVLATWLTGQTLSPAYGANQTICKFFSQLPDDCAEAENHKYDGLRGYRYQEIDLFAKDALKKIPYVSMYNTTGLNGGEDSHELGAKVAQRSTRPQEDRETLPGDLRSDQPSSLLDGRLVDRQGRRRTEF